MRKNLIPYHLRPPNIDRPGVPSDPKDGRYWPQVGGKPFDPGDVAGREKIMEAAVGRVRRSTAKSS